MLSVRSCFANVPAESEREKTGREEIRERGERGTRDVRA